MAEQASVITFDDIDLSDLTFWGRPIEERRQAFALLRAQNGPTRFTNPYSEDGSGYWALVRHSDVVAASRNPAVFSSEPDAMNIVDPPEFLAKYTANSMLNMDDPRHAKVRGIVSRAFTPRMLAQIRDDIHRRATRLVDELIATGPGDFVAKVAARLPIEVICSMLGIPEEHHSRIVTLTNLIMGNTDEDFDGITADMDMSVIMQKLTEVAQAHEELHDLAAKLGSERLANPTDDLTSAVVHASVDGKRLSENEFGNFFELLLIAGNETTRTSIAHGLKQFTDHPDQRALLLSDFDSHIAGAVEEIVRYATPVIGFRRNVTRDHEMNGHRYEAGDRVMLCYYSANRDDTVFSDPDRFDITRNPNPHVSFGGPGPHFCLGANLARLEITAIFRELFTRLPDIHADGEPDRIVSSLTNGFKRLSCTFTAP